MEVLMSLIKTQEEYEDALRVEIEYSECCSTKEGKRLLKWLRARRRAVYKLVKKFS